MKRSILGLALLAPLTTLVHAQSSVQVSGTADGGVRYQTSADTAGNHRPAGLQRYPLFMHAPQTKGRGQVRRT